jgi:thioredoxin reductase (NADPH)
VALLLADHRMPRMNGIEFLTAAIQQFPDVRRVLLTAYADTEAAIGAINLVKLDYYLLKPGTRPTETFIRCSTICWISGQRAIARRLTEPAS